MMSRKNLSKDSVAGTCEWRSKTIAKTNDGVSDRIAMIRARSYVREISRCGVLINEQVRYVLHLLRGSAGIYALRSYSV